MPARMMRTVPSVGSSAHHPGKALRGDSINSAIAIIAAPPHPAISHTTGTRRIFTVAANASAGQPGKRSRLAKRLPSINSQTRVNGMKNVAAG